MLGFSMVQLTRQHSRKFDREMRQRLIHIYQPFRRIPCFLHRPIEKMLSKLKQFPVIIEFEQQEAHTSFNTAKEVINQETRCRITNEFASISSCSAVLTANTFEKLMNSGCRIKKIYHDREVTAFLDVASSSIHATQLNSGGITGKNVNIAVLDTGVDPHQDLLEPSNRIIAFKDLINNRLEPYDDNGHGTHCAGDAAGNGFSSGGKYSGPAPEAGIIGVKVLNKMGSGSLSTIISGIQWCIDHKEEHQINIISLSLGAAADESNCNDPLVQIAEQAWENGMVVCAAAGNSGPDQQTIGTPAISGKIVTVGAIDDRNTTDRADEQIAPFSSRGPACGGIAKPDLLAPGVNIISLRSPGSFLDKTSKSSRVDADYFSLSGTSMATPICAGVAALILQFNPEFSPDDVKRRLIESCVDIGLEDYEQGAGYLDAARAVSPQTESIEN